MSYPTVAPGMHVLVYRFEPPHLPPALDTILRVEGQSVYLRMYLDAFDARTGVERRKGRAKFRFEVASALQVEQILARDECQRLAHRVVQWAANQKNNPSPSATLRAVVALIEGAP